MAFISIHSCLSSLFLGLLLVCDIAHKHLCMSFSVHSLCPTLGSAVYCAFLKRFAMCPKPIPLWHLLFETPGPCSLVILLLPARGKYLFVFLIVLKPFVLCKYFLSALEHHQISRFTPTHTSFTSPGMARGQRRQTHTQRKEHTIEICIQFSTQSRFMLCRLITMKPDHAAVSHCSQT